MPGLSLTVSVGSNVQQTVFCRNVDGEGVTFIDPARARLTTIDAFDLSRISREMRFCVIVL